MDVDTNNGSGELTERRGSIDVLNNSNTELNSKPKEMEEKNARQASKLFG